MIPLVRPRLPDFEWIERYFSKSRESGKLTNFGPCYDALCDRLYNINGRYHVPCTNGTVAIQLAAQVHFKRGYRVLCPDYTHIGTLQALLAAGMQPILASTDNLHWTLNTINLTTYKNAYDAFIVVSPFGYSVDFEGYDEFSRELKKPVIYDLAGGFGMKIKTSNPVSFSLHATKSVPIGEGGVVSFKSIEEQRVGMKLSCFDQNKDRTIGSPFGGNHKLDELRCAVALAQFEDLSAIKSRIEAKRRLIDFYQRVLSKYIVEHSNHTINAAPSLCVLAGLPPGLEKLDLGFEIKQYYPLLSDMEGLSNIDCVSQSSPFFRTCMALPSDVTEEESELIANAILFEVSRAKVRRK